MRRQHVLAALYLVLMTVFVSGCAYVHVQRPLDIDYDKTTLGTKVGRSHVRSVLWLVTWGDGGTKAAAEDGGLTTITHADTKYFSILFGLYTRITTVVYGD